MRRVRGLETEYGLQVRVRPLGAATPAGWRRLSSDEAAQRLFAPVVEAHAATNAWLRNGGRLYLDVGSHPEYATAECSTLAELVAQDRAGDLVLAQLAHRAQQAWAQEGLEPRISIFKNNVDSHANSYGSHENFQVSRKADLAGTVQALTPFLVTRQLLCGAGHWQRDRLGRGHFLLSQRAEHMWDPLSAATTRSRPMVNTRDEPHADAERFRRLHVIVGDSTLLDHTTLLRVGSMELALRILEARSAGSTTRSPSLSRGVSEPGLAIRRVAADLTGRTPVTEDGATALQVQWEWWRAAEAFVDDEELRTVHELWAQVLIAVEDGAPGRIADRIDWAAKHRLLRAQRERHGMASDDPRLAQLALAWHDIIPGQGLARLAEQRGQVQRWLAPGVDERSVEEPPQTTRAVLRASFITAAQQHRRDHTVDWMTLACHDLDGGQVRVEDPLTTQDGRVDELIRRMDTEPRRARSSSFRSGLPWSPSTLG
ncbi:proteasome accessory factor A [Luteococcus japonicus]|uniref:Proteasome accessory factor A n=1 Tax=Luteococcus japonicus TaxID=33984 RepID=A0A3N1ZYE5_9ACTN|nr:proteasome accessory factor PafA2 family protein [Luteococcus japonicus]ROR55870.1 proteasome accessory factor A [Luteococcus japonicus]